MIKSILSGYAKFFINIGKALLLAALCVAISFIIVFPLWLWAYKSPNVYSLVIGIVFLTAILVFAIIKIVTSLKNKSTEEKKVFRFNIFRNLLILLIILATIVGCIILVMSGIRLFALILLIIGIILFGVCNFGIKKK